MTDKGDARILKGLSLPLARGHVPFELSMSEREFSADDWAWQFLRLNPEYQSAYESDQERRFSASPDAPNRIRYSKRALGMKRNIKPEEHYCRARFGISTWLDPHSQDRLPSLKGREESWFFPLRAIHHMPEDENGRAAKLELFGYAYCDLIHAKYIFPEEERLALKDTGPLKVRFAIDCSIPTVGQLDEVERLCYLHRDWINHNIHTEGWSYLISPKSSHYPKVQTIAPASPIQGLRANEARASTPKCLDKLMLWRELVIDVRRPIKEQLEEARSVLAAVHLDLVANDMAKKPAHTRLRVDCAPVVESDGQPYSDGNYLKALIVVSELSSMGMNCREIDSLLYRMANPEIKKVSQSSEEVAKESVSSNENRFPEPEARERRIAAYKQDALYFIDSGYKWLIDTDRPKSERQDWSDKVAIRKVHT